MSDRSKLIFTFALGAIAGIAIVKLLESEKGKEFIASAKDKAQSTADDIKEKINQLQQELADLVETQKDNIV